VGSGDESDAERDIEDLSPEEAREVSPVHASTVLMHRPLPRQEIYEKGGDAYLPGRQNIFLKVWGCSHSVSDKEYMAGMLQDYGYAIVDSDEQADLAVLVSCTVKNPSEDHFLTYLEKLQARGVKVIAAGCVPQAEANHPRLVSVSLMGTQQIDRIVEAVEQTLQGNVVRMMSQRKRPELDLPKIRRNPFVEIIPINVGCLNSCTYCKTKQARGKLGSYTIQAILDRISQVVKEGVTEIWMTSEDTGAYGRDINTNISELLLAVLQLIEQHPHVMLKLGMTNPPYMYAHLSTIIEVLSHPQVFSILHIPVQSGSNKILGLMKREYTVEQFQYIVDQLTANVPGVTIATDIICGFPYEDENDFNATYELVEKNRFTVMHTTQFYPRKGTPAAKMPKVNSLIVKNRTRTLTTLFESYDCYRSLVGTTQRVWITNEKAKDQQHLIGHTKSYVQVLLPFDERYFGKSTVVRITDCSRFSVTGEYMEPAPSSPHGHDQSNKRIGMMIGIVWEHMSRPTGVVWALGIALGVGVAMSIAFSRARISHK
jgi:threonylcarbamoyladenosine tRNA methylthiotransferase CDKAL1